MMEKSSNYNGVEHKGRRKKWAEGDKGIVIFFHCSKYHWIRKSELEERKILNSKMQKRNTDIKWCKHKMVLKDLQQGLDILS